MINRLSNRELDVLQCLAEGLTTSETAEFLNIAKETVKTHRSNLLLKMNAKNAFQLGMSAIRFNLLTIYNNKRISVA